MIRKDEIWEKKVAELQSYFNMDKARCEAELEHEENKEESDKSWIRYWKGCISVIGDAIKEIDRILLGKEVKP